MKWQRTFACIAVSALVVVFYTPISHAFEATSTSFELHGATIQSISGSSTATNYKNRSGGGQSATGISTNVKKVYSGVLYWIAGLFTAQYEEAHYRWRNDDGSESAATFAASEDSAYINFPQSVKKRIRFAISNSGWTRGTAPQFKLEVASGASCSGGSYAAVPVNTTSSAWMITTSTNVTDGTATTNVASGLTDANNTFVAGQVKTTGNTTAAITLTSEQFTEIEYVVVANPSSTGSYCFRVTNNGSTTGMLFTQYAQATVSAGLSPTGDLTSATFDTGVTEGAAYNSFTWLGTVGTGKVRFKFATSNSSSGPWSFIGSADGGVTCTTGFWYEAPTPDSPVEISCNAGSHNNQRFYRYQIQLCSNTDCSTSGATSPVVTSTIVNWSP